MNDIIIKISKLNRTALPEKTFIGNDGENLQNKMVFEFIDNFIDGIARLEYKIDDTKNFIWLNKLNNTYYIPIKDILTKEGNVSFQLVITEEANVNGIPLYKSDIFNLYCKPSINAVNEAPSGYELWIDEANAKLIEFDKKINEVDNLNIEATRVYNGVEVKITYKNGNTKTVKVNDGLDGNGIVSITKTATVGLVDTYTITYSNGNTTTFYVTNGKDGIDGEVTEKEFNKAMMVYNALPKVSDTDTYITLNNSAECPLSLDLKGNTNQADTPTPNDPVDVLNVTGNNDILICGENLFDKDNTNLINGYVNYNTGIFNAPSGSNQKCFYIKIKPNTTYTWSNYVSNVTVGYGLYTNIPTANTSSNSYSYISSSNTITTGANDNYLVMFYYSTSATINLSTFMLSESSTTIPYDPYQGKTYYIYLPMENIFNKNNVIENRRIDPNGALFIDNSYICSDFIHIKANTTYTFNPLNQYNCVALYTENKTFIQRIGFNGETQLTTTSDTYYCRIAINRDLKNTFKFKEDGTTPIELCKIGDYQDYIYKNNDNWYIHKAIGKVVLDGSESWSINKDKTYVYQFYCNHFANDLNLDDCEIKSNYFKYQTGDPTDTTNEDYGWTYRKAILIDIRKSVTSSLANFKSWLSTHNTSVYYVLATSTDTQITDTTLIGQLNELEYAYSYDEQTNILQTNYASPFIISATGIRSLTNIFDGGA